MAKTAQAISPRRAKVELVISAALFAAIPYFGMAETVDISSVVKAVNGGGLTREVVDEYVVGDATPIKDYDQRLTRANLQIVFLYTNAKELLGSHATNKWDLHKALRQVAEYTTTDLSVQFIISWSGGAVGDEEFTTSATESYIAGLTDPVGGADSSGKVQVTLDLATPTFVASVVS